MSEVTVARELTLDARSDPEIWAACIGGALTKPDLMRAAEDTGFVDCEIAETFMGLVCELRLGNSASVLWSPSS